MKILLTGSTGLFGSYFIRKTDKISNIEVIGISRRSSNKLDITDKRKTIKLINDINPDVIVHVASIGNVDYCEANPQEAWSVNVEGTRNIIRGAKLTNSVVIFLSSNAVYDGENPFYSEKSRRNPIDFYGKTKLQSENDIKRSGLKSVIVRLITMYGWYDKSQRKNPVIWIIDELNQSHKLNVVNDIFNNHLYVGQAVDAVFQIIKLKKWNEIYNIAGRDCISRYQLALEVADVFSLDNKLINPVKSSFFQTLAPRPKNTCFLTSKMERDLSIKPLSVREGLRLMKEDQL